MKERFLSKIEKTETCWFWKSRVRKGYGLFQIKNKRYFAHRISWKIHYGEIPFGLSVCHKCDVKNCVNPNHLFLGTNRDNINDMVSKNRQSKGEQIGISKLNQESVKKIRDLYIPRKFGCKKIARMFGVDKRTITSIVSRKTWNWVV